MEPILVTGATGKTGNVVASELPTRRCLAADSQRWYAEHVPVDGSAVTESQASAAWN